jgi:uncharacterized protein (TIGR03435 family)
MTAARRLSVTAAALVTVACATSLAAQSPQMTIGAAAFDVASVRRYQPVPGRGTNDGINVMPGGRLLVPGATLRGLIAAAFGVLDIQILDGGRLPANDRFTIDATTRPDVTVDDARSMLRTLLAERFRLTAHAEQRELQVYVLTVARDDRRLGEQLRRSGPECSFPKGPAGIPAPPPPPAGSGPDMSRALPLGAAPLRCANLLFHSTVGAHFSLREMTLGRFADRLTATLGRPVLDRTRLDGAFDIDLTYTPDAATLDTASAPNAPSLLTALREQLGLRLESSRELVDVLVIDGVESPTEN